MKCLKLLSVPLKCLVPDLLRNTNDLIRVGRLVDSIQENCQIAGQRERNAIGTFAADNIGNMGVDGITVAIVSTRELIGLIVVLDRIAVNLGVDRAGMAYFVYVNNIVGDKDRSLAALDNPVRQFVYHDAVLTVDDNAAFGFEHRIEHIFTVAVHNNLLFLCADLDDGFIYKVKHLPQKMGTPVIEVAAAILLINLPVIAFTESGGAAADLIYLADLARGNNLFDGTQIGSPVLGEEHHQLNAELFLCFLGFFDNKFSIFYANSPGLGCGNG